MIDADAFPTEEGIARARTGAAEPRPAAASDETPGPVAIVFPSRSAKGGSGHVVTVNATDTIACTCEAGSYGRECWAVKSTRRMIGKED